MNAQEKLDKATATLRYVMDAHTYDGALTNGSANLSPAIAAMIYRVLRECEVQS